jgi:hypothetical protein
MEDLHEQERPNLAKTAKRYAVPQKGFEIGGITSLLSRISTTSFLSYLLSKILL